jgi:hypothetical protein
MCTSPKIRAFLLLVAALFTTMALSLPEPAAACWLGIAQDCYNPDGSYCFDHPCTSSNECPGATCYPGGEYCCPNPR